METNRTAKQKIIWKSYLRLALVSMFVLLASSICGFIDNVVISQVLGPKALAAVGYFTPVSSIICASYLTVPVFGTKAAWLANTWSGLCVEEVARNVLEHGSFKENKNHVNVRVVCKDELTIRIADDCRKFDPRDYMRLFDKETPEKAIGLRMVAGFSSDIDYYNNAGINTLIIKI